MGKIAKYENLIRNINYSIEKWTFDINKNQKVIKRIMEIYKFSKNRDYKKVWEHIEKLLKNKIYFQDFISPKTRDWDNIEIEDNVEAYNSVEVVSAIFLQNLKDKLWEK